MSLRGTRFITIVLAISHNGLPLSAVRQSTTTIPSPEQTTFVGMKSLWHGVPMDIRVDPGEGPRQLYIRLIASSTRISMIGLA
jgi:hypothetical protein